MRNPVNRLATAAPRALDSLLTGKSATQTATTGSSTHTTTKTSTTTNSPSAQTSSSSGTSGGVEDEINNRGSRSWSFDLMSIDLGVVLDDLSVTNTTTTMVGMDYTTAMGEGSVVTFEDLSNDFDLHLLDLDGGGGGGGGSDLL